MNCNRNAAFSIRGLPWALFILSLFMSGRPATAQFPPDSFTNLKVLPEDIETRALINTMRGFSSALGVRCQYCHVGEAGASLSTFDFASDEKETKRKARVMLRMLGHINNEHLEDLPSRGDPPVAVECATCHRGQPRPRMSDDVLLEAYDGGGIDSMVAKYRELRQRYYGSHTFDFRWFILNNLATQIASQGNFADAVQLGALNVEFFPDNPQVQRAYAVGAVELVMEQEGVEAGVARFREFRNQYPEGVFSENAMIGWGYSLLNRRKVDQAVVVFKLSVDMYPDAFNTYDSLGEGYMVAGNRELAIENYERSLELNPENTNAARMLEQLRSQQ